MHLFGHSPGGPTVFAACHYDLMARLHDLAKRQLSACPQALEFEAGKVVTLQGAMSGFLLDSRFSNSSTVLWSLTSLNLVNPATLHLDRYKEVAGAPSRAGFALRYLVACIDGGKVYPSLVHTIIDLVRQCAQLNRAEKHAFENLVREVFFRVLHLVTWSQKFPMIPSSQPNLKPSTERACGQPSTERAC